MPVVEVVIVTPLRLFGDTLARCLRSFEEIHVADVLGAPAQLLSLREGQQPQLVLIDVTAGIEAVQIKAILRRWPALRLLALGQAVLREAVVDCERAGFVGYLARDASLAQVRQAILDAATGQWSGPAALSAHLVRALRSARGQPVADGGELTQRETQVASFIVRGLSNKEIAR